MIRARCAGVPSRLRTEVHPLKSAHPTTEIHPPRDIEEKGR